MKEKMLTLRIDSDIMEYLDRASEEIKAVSGIPVNRTWVIIELLRAGKEEFERLYKIKIAMKKNN